MGGCQVVHGRTFYRVVMEELSEQRKKEQQVQCPITQRQRVQATGSAPGLEREMGKE